VGNAVSVALAAGYFLWGGWRRAKLVEEPAPHGGAPDTGLSPPLVVEETEAADASAHVAAFRR
jgi:hypothetical protein